MMVAVILAAQFITGATLSIGRRRTRLAYQDGHCVGGFSGARGQGGCPSRGVPYVLTCEHRNTIIGGLLEACGTIYLSSSKS